MHKPEPDGPPSPNSVDRYAGLSSSERQVAQRGDLDHALVKARLWKSGALVLLGMTLVFGAFAVMQGGVARRNDDRLRQARLEIAVLRAQLRDCPRP